MKIQDMNENALITSFSSTKRQILVILKREGQMDLPTLSKELNLTKMGVLNHINQLEEMEIIERFKINIGVGRPRTAFRLAPNSKDIFPKAYSSITTSVLQFIETELGRRAVYRALKSRQDEIKEEYLKQLDELPFAERVSTLAKIRDHEGYMVELNMVPNSESYEMMEFNCPILSVADTYGEACQVEEELFREILGADVTTTHRTVSGDNVCRFLIRPK
ncbi:MAG: helix-turn-helix transcriptional regulator [Candidatus Kariarchaeaceae archaeon]|jgi:predicted ArsR family transcriptional regulator